MLLLWMTAGECCCGPVHQQSVLHLLLLAVTLEMACLFGQTVQAASPAAPVPSSSSRVQ
jgi:hypothetical protein